MVSLIALKSGAGLAIRGGTPSRGQKVKDLFVLNLHPNLTVRFSFSVSLGAGFSGTRTAAVMQRALFSRSAQLAQQAAAALDSPLAGRSAPLLQRLDRSMSSVTIPPPACMLKPLEAPLRYLFGPGPSNVPPRVLAAGGRPIIGHLHPEMYEVKSDWVVIIYFLTVKILSGGKILFFF